VGHRLRRHVLPTALVRVLLVDEVVKRLCEKRGTLRRLSAICQPPSDECSFGSNGRF
jgi:hypothetical protein